MKLKIVLGMLLIAQVLRAQPPCSYSLQDLKGQFVRFQVQVATGNSEKTKFHRNEFLATLGMTPACTLWSEGHQRISIRIGSYRYSYLSGGRQIDSGTIGNPLWPHSLTDKVLYAKFGDRIIISNVILSFPDSIKRALVGYAVDTLILTLISPSYREPDPDVRLAMEALRQIPEYSHLGNLFGSNINIGKYLSFYDFTQKDTSGAVVRLERIWLYHGRGQATYSWTFWYNRRERSYFVWDHNSNKAMSLRDWKMIARKIR